jgi:Domain of unknown function (DUF1839)
MCWPSTEPGRHVLVRLDPATYRRHAIHGEERAWAETNCYTDLLVELAHAHGFEPAAMLPFTLAIDFEGDQWTFFKPSPCDLFDLYGFDVQELAIWRPLADHVAEQVEAGHPVLVEVDSYYLPDTAGTAYRLAHGKTTIGVNDIDLERARMGYFHNAGYFEVEGDDFRALLQVDGRPGAEPGGLSPVWIPYVEYIKWRHDFVPPRNGALVGRSLEIARRHLARVPRDNPFRRFKARLARDLDWLMREDIGRFHAYSFATLRQYGACYELAATWLRWLSSHGVAGLEPPAAALQAIAEGAKALQFQLARSMSRRKPLELAPLDVMASQWEEAVQPLRKRLA